MSNARNFAIWFTVYGSVFSLVEIVIYRAHGMQAKDWLAALFLSTLAGCFNVAMRGN